jgi:hypothetical protein
LFPALVSGNSRSCHFQSVSQGVLMKFTEIERGTLLGVKGGGPTVILRLEKMGDSSLEQLAERDPNDILARGALLSGSTCWKNSPQAKEAVSSAIAAAIAVIHTRRLSR